MKVITNFFWFLMHWIKFRDLRRTTKEEKQKRLSICNECPLINRKGFLVKIKGPRCGICGCFLQYKSNYIFEDCPDNPSRWPKIDI